METLSTGENIFLGVLGLLLLFWMKPGIKSAIETSKNAKSYWMGAIMPLGLVVLFVVLLVLMVKR